jgi:predicted nucleic acid-binding protein
MKRLVLDGSATLGLLMPDERGSEKLRKVRAALEAGTPTHVPAHWWVELTNGVLMAERRGRITQAVATEILGLIAALDVLMDDETELRVTSDVAALARQQKLTAYDAAYLELAIRLGGALASQDKELLEAAIRCGVETVS